MGMPPPSSAPTSASTLLSSMLKKIRAEFVFIAAASVEGSIARCGADQRDQTRGDLGRGIRRAEDRCGEAARVQGRCGEQVDRRAWHGRQAAQGYLYPGRSELCEFDDAEGEEGCRRGRDAAIRQSDYCHGIISGAAGAAGCERREHSGLDRGAGSEGRAEDFSGHRRRLHRAGTGIGLCFAGIEGGCGRDDSGVVAGRRPRSDSAAAEAFGEAVQQDHAEHVSDSVEG